MTLFRMNELKFGGISEKALIEEARKFIDYTKKILDGPFGKQSSGMTEIVHFDGK